MLTNLILFLKKILLLPKKKYKKSIFIKNACFLGNGRRNTLIGENAFCQNESNDKKNITIGEFCDIEGRLSANGKNAKIKIGNYTTIRAFSEIGATESIEIGNYVIISNNVTIYDNNNHPTDPFIRKEMCQQGFYSEKWAWKYSEHKPVVIHDNVWLGEKSTILKGVTIGEGSIIACRSVVTKDVPSYSIVAGNPAVLVKKLNFTESK